MRLRRDALCLRDEPRGRRFRRGGDLAFLRDRAFGPSEEVPTLNKPVISSSTFHFLSTAQGWIVLSAVVVVVTGAIALLARGRSGLNCVARQMERRIARRVPRDTMRVVAAGDLHWDPATLGGREAMQVVGTWLVTNPMTGSHTNLVVAGLELRLALRNPVRLDPAVEQLNRAHRPGHVRATEHLIERDQKRLPEPAVVMRRGATAISMYARNP